MSVAFSTRTSPDGASRLVPAAALARALGFGAIHAAAPVVDAAKGRDALARHDLELCGVATAGTNDVASVGAAIDAAAAVAASLRARLVVVEAGALRGRPREPVERTVDALARALHAALRRHPGLALALRSPDGPGRPLGLVETEWLASDLAGEPFGFWFDTAGALRVERSAAGTRVLDWADRFGSRTLGLAVHGLGDGEGHARPEDDGPDWSTLRGLVPAVAPRVLELSPSTPSKAVEESRRFVEHVLGKGA